MPELNCNCGGYPSSSYVLMANDRISIEYRSSAPDGIDIPVSTTEAIPGKHNGTTWANTAANRPLAVAIKMMQEA